MKDMRASKIRVNCGGWTTRWRKRGPLYIDCRGVVDRDGDWGHFRVKIKEFFKKWLERDYRKWSIPFVRYVYHLQDRGNLPESIRPPKDLKSNFKNRRDDDL